MLHNMHIAMQMRLSLDSKPHSSNFLQSKILALFQAGRRIHLH